MSATLRMLSTANPVTLFYVMAVYALASIGCGVALGAALATLATHEPNPPSAR